MSRLPYSLSDGEFRVELPQQLSHLSVVCDLHRLVEGAPLPVLMLVAECHSLGILQLSRPVFHRLRFSLDLVRECLVDVLVDGQLLLVDVGLLLRLSQCRRPLVLTRVDVALGRSPVMGRVGGLEQQELDRWRTAEDNEASCTDGRDGGHHPIDDIPKSVEGFLLFTSKIVKGERSYELISIVCCESCRDGPRADHLPLKN
ncbi:hypothetical protein PMAYCL1PPCAC_25180, partial [Pristionchus mayeri]